MITVLTVVDVVPMMNVQIPSTNLGYLHPEPVDPDGPRDPDGGVAAARVLVADGDLRPGPTEHLLLVHVPLVPDKVERDVRLGLEDLLDDAALDRELEADDGQLGRDLGAGQLEPERGHEAERVLALVDEVEVGFRDLDGFLQNL